MCGAINRLGVRKAKHEKYSILIKWWFISTAAFLSTDGFAQLQQVKRLEIPIASELESFGIIPADQNGFLLHRVIIYQNSGHLELNYVDTTFIEKWRGSLPIEKNEVMTEQAVVDNNVYFVLFHPTLANRDFQICRIDLKEGIYTKFIVKNNIPFFPITLKVTQLGALIGGYFNGVPVVLFFDFKTEKSKILPGLFNEPGELDQIKTNQDNSFDLLVNYKGRKKNQTLWLKNYDPWGKLIRSVILKDDGINRLVFGRMVETKGGNHIVTGVYGKNDQRSQGFFIAQIDVEGLQQIQYHSFADLENFFKYMKANQEKRIKKKIERKKIKGKKVRFQYHFLVHELIPYKNQFILLGEAFVKKYKTISAPGYAGQSYSVQNIFDGYQYTHAAVLGISPIGKILWDNSFEINDIKTFTLDQFVKIDTQPDKIVLFYLFDNKIRTKIIQNSMVLEGKTSSPIKTQLHDELIEESTSVNQLEHWYDDYFLAYGVQDIHSVFRTNQKVFFINKISYR